MYKFLLILFLALINSSKGMDLEGFWPDVHEHDYAVHNFSVRQELDTYRIIDRATSITFLGINIVSFLLGNDPPLVALITLYPASIYMAASIEWSKCYNACRNDEEKKLLSEMVFQQRQQAWFFALAGMCKIVDPLFSYPFFPIAIRDIGLGFLIAGVINSALFNQSVE